MDKVEAEIISLLEEYFYVKKGHIKSDTLLEQVINDSMDFIELVAMMTTRYKISINPKSITKIRTVGDIAQFVTQSMKTSEENPSRF